ncbi:MAG: hypothetical protein WC110_11890 [Bacteroidales bacterium]|jgi:hypothetical protein
MATLKQLTVVLALAALTAGAAEHYVGTTAALTNAIATAASNDTVWVSNGVYTCTTPMEAKSFLHVGAGVTVRSISGNPADVVLDGDTMGGDDGVCAPGGCDLRGRGLAGRKEIKK